MFTENFIKKGASYEKNPQKTILRFIDRSHGMCHDSSCRQRSDQLFQDPDCLHAHIRKGAGIR